MQSDDRVHLDELLTVLATIYRREGRPGGDLASAALLSAATKSFDYAVTNSASLGLLINRACDQEKALALAKTIQSCWAFFTWSNWGEGTLTEDVASNLYTAELVGPDGLFKDDRVRVGLLLSEAATDYPISSHSGEETYYVISGLAEWSVDGSPYRIRNPGSFIHHPAWVPHGRRTLDEVFLGAWRWSGDLNLDSFNVAD